jgi:hypothetical protein
MSLGIALLPSTMMPWTVEEGGARLIDADVREGFAPTRGPDAAGVSIETVVLQWLHARKRLEEGVAKPRKG